MDPMKQEPGMRDTSTQFETIDGKVFRLDRERGAIRLFAVCSGEARQVSTAETAAERAAWAKACRDAEMGRAWSRVVLVVAVGARKTVERLKPRAARRLPGALPRT